VYKTLLTEQQHVETLNTYDDAPVSGKRLRVSLEESNMRTTLLLDYLADPARGFSHESQIKFAEIDRTFSFPYGFSSHKFRGMANECPTFSHFQDQIAWIREKFTTKEAGENTTVTASRPGSI
jgi:hypothetical protein